METIQGGSLTDAAAMQLRNAILSGELQPGQQVRVRDLQDRMGISHIPIREAIRQLEAEGLIVTSPRRTPVVASVDLDDLAAIYELRHMIELPIVRRARERATEADVRAVREAFAAFEAVAMDPNTAEFSTRHIAFHQSLVEPGCNAWTRRVLDPLGTGAERYVRLFVSQYSTPGWTLHLHRMLLDAYEVANPEEIVVALENHFNETERVVREGFQKQQHAARFGPV